MNEEEVTEHGLLTQIAIEGLLKIQMLKTQQHCIKRSIICLDDNENQYTIDFTIDLFYDKCENCVELNENDLDFFFEKFVRLKKRSLQFTTSFLKIFLMKITNLPSDAVQIWASRYDANGSTEVRM